MPNNNDNKNAYLYYMFGLHTTICVCGRRTFAALKCDKRLKAGCDAIVTTLKIINTSVQRVP